MRTLSTNPYVGPRPFKEEEWKLFFGREQEGEDLLSIVLADRLVLFFAPSGAGKSSLLNTSLRRGLRQSGFDVLATARVSGDASEQVNNIFVYNLILDLDKDQHDKAVLATMSLADYLHRFQPPSLGEDGKQTKRQVVIIDQFEEIFTTHPEAWEQREEFFRQLRQAMQSDSDSSSRLVVIIDQFEEIFTTHPEAWGEQCEEFFKQLRQAMKSNSDSSSQLVVIIDQFEEMFTTHPEAWGEQCEELFGQLRKAMKSNSDSSSRLWVVLAMREENVAALDRYKHLLPGRLRTRFYMQKLDHDAALQAIMEPADTGGRPFESSSVAEELVKNLSLVWARDHERKEYPGEFVEPVQLQVVCHQLWAELAVHPDTEIRLADKIRMKDLTCIAGSTDLVQFVDTALARFYEEAVHAVAATGIAEGVLRNWFEEQLITGAGTRNLVYCDIDNDNTGGLPNRAVETLASRLLIHEESRSAGSFYELIHDRLIDPILSANRQWYEKNPGILLARAWKDAGRSPTKLLEGQLLQEAKEKHWQTLTPLVAEFIDTSRAVQKAKLRVRALWLGIATVAIAFVLSVLALNAWNSGQMAKTRTVGFLVSEAQRKIKEEPQLSLLLAEQAVSLSSETYVLKNLNETLAAITSAPLRGQDQQVITDVLKVAISTNNEWLAAGGADGRVHIWALTVGDPEIAQATLYAHAATVSAIAFSSDGRWLSTGGMDAIVNLFDLRASPWVPIKIQLDQAQGAVVGLAFRPTTGPTQPWLAVSQKEGVVQSIDLSTMNPPLVSNLMMKESKDTATLAFSPNGQWLATGNGTDTLRVWPLLGQRVAISGSRLLSTGKTGIIVFAFSPDGRWLATGNNTEPSVYLFDLVQPGASPFLLPGHEQGVRTIAFSLDSGSRSITESQPISLPFGTLAVGGGDGVVRLWVLDLLTRTTEITSTKPTAPIPTRPGSTESPVQLAPKLPNKAVEPTFIPANMEPMRLPQRQEEILALTFTKEEGETAKMWLAVAGADRAVQIWDLDALSAPKYIVYGHDDAVTSVFWGANAALMFTQSQDRTVRVWNREIVSAPQDVAQLVRELPMWLDEACRRAGRDFRADERVEYLGDLQTQSSCSASRASPRR